MHAPGACCAGHGLNETSSIAPKPRRFLHPMVVLGALGAVAVSVLAGVQVLRQPEAPPAPAAAAAAAAGGKPAATAPARTARAPNCVDCGVVVAVRQSKQAGEGTGVGVVAGGVIGGVVGNQFGRGQGRDAMTVAGAVGGAVAGHHIERQARAKVVHHVDVKMDDGTTRTFNYAAAPGFAVGARVQAQGGQLALRR